MAVGQENGCVPRAEEREYSDALKRTVVYPIHTFGGRGSPASQLPR
jgi:hypothetical protein